MLAPHGPVPRTGGVQLPCLEPMARSPLTSRSLGPVRARHLRLLPGKVGAHVAPWPVGPPGRWRVPSAGLVP
eukprot:7421661-Alexandrium_andersonii.AAC.1